MTAYFKTERTSFLHISLSAVYWNLAQLEISSRNVISFQGLEVNCSSSAVYTRFTYVLVRADNLDEILHVTTTTSIRK